jgi:hypothetical protein
MSFHLIFKRRSNDETQNFFTKKPAIMQAFYKLRIKSNRLLLEQSLSIIAR